MAESTCNAPHSSHSQAPWGPCLSPSASPAPGASHPPSSPALTGGWGPWQPPGPRPQEGSWRRAPGENTSRSAPGGHLCPQSPPRGGEQQQQHFPIRTMRALGTNKRGSGQDRRPPQYSATLLVSRTPLPRITQRSTLLNTLWTPTLCSTGLPPRHGATSPLPTCRRTDHARSAPVPSAPSPTVVPVPRHKNKDPQAPARVAFGPLTGFRERVWRGSPAEVTSDRARWGRGVARCGS